MGLLDPKWKYHTAEESREPGYLKRRFNEIRRKQCEADKLAKEDELEQASKVRKIGRGL